MGLTGSCPGQQQKGYTQAFTYQNITYVVNSILNNCSGASMHPPSVGSWHPCVLSRNHPVLYTVFYPAPESQAVSCPLIGEVGLPRKPFMQEMSLNKNEDQNQNKWKWDLIQI
ncbi:hypothetical protein ILYODFUR_036251 [Ilyodon furcidens]|uniref:Uncharacterized protein n=1 Tax=Ilyodon furcidens TaxID=33524 RepID=A0ABV0V0S4_9TELE